MEDANSRDAGLLFEDQESALEGSPNFNSGIIQDPKSKIQKGRGPFVVTPRRRAAMLANLDKARAAPKEKVYGPSEKRRTANHANLQKAHAARAAARAERQAFRSASSASSLPSRQGTRRACKRARKAEGR